MCMCVRVCVCACVCVCARVRVHVYMCTHIWVFVRETMNVYVHLGAYMWSLCHAVLHMQALNMLKVLKHSALG